MYTHPSFVLDMARQHQQDLIEEASRWRLLNLARLSRRDRSNAKTKTVARPAAGTLAGCGPREAAPAR